MQVALYEIQVKLKFQYVARLRMMALGLNPFTPEIL